MQLNEIHNPETEHAAVSLKVILLIFAIILVGVLSYLVWDYQTAPDTTDYSVPKLTNSSSEAAETASATTVDCGDDAYAFDLTFGDKWTGYKVKTVTPTYALSTCYVTMPTATSDTNWTVAGEDHDAGYASVFAVSVYTIAQWTAALAEANPPAQLAFDGTYYWGWAPAQALPQDLQDSKISGEVQALVATFALPN